MAIEITDAIGRAGSSLARERKYHVRETTGATLEESAVFDALQAYAPTSVYIGDIPANQKLLGLEDIQLEEVLPSLWSGTVTYGVIPGGQPAPAPDPGGEATYEFETSLESRHVTFSKATVASYFNLAKLPDGAPSFNKAISVGANGAEGVDILVPTSKFSYRYTGLVSAITAAYQRNVEDLVGTVNDATFKGRPAGSVMFEGVSGSLKTYEMWDLYYRFAYRPNRTDVTITGIDRLMDTGDPPGPPVEDDTISVKGWELLWVYTGEADEPNLKNPVHIPLAVYVEQVYDEGDFSILGIGV